MVLEVSANPKRYIALEGNRRVAALRLLNNPAAMTGLDMPNGMQRSIERLAKIFERSKVEPIDCFEVSSREEGRYWIELRHNGEDEGRGVVAWKPIVAARFREKELAIQAFDIVMEHGSYRRILVTSGSGGSGLSLRSDDLDSVVELYTQDDFRQLVVTTETMPTFLCGLRELEDHSERGLVGKTSS